MAADFPARSGTCSSCAGCWPSQRTSFASRTLPSRSHTRRVPGAGEEGPATKEIDCTRSSGTVVVAGGVRPVSTTSGSSRRSTKPRTTSPLRRSTVSDAGSEGGGSIPSRTTQRTPSLGSSTACTRRCRQRSRGSPASSLPGSRSPVASATTPDASGGAMSSRSAPRRTTSFHGMVRGAAPVAAPGAVPGAAPGAVPGAAPGTASAAAPIHAMPALVTDCTLPRSTRPSASTRYAAEARGPDDPAVGANAAAAAVAAAASAVRAPDAVRRNRPGRPHAGATGASITSGRSAGSAWEPAG